MDSKIYFASGQKSLFFSICDKNIGSLNKKERKKSKKEFSYSFPKIMWVFFSKLSLTDFNGYVLSPVI